MPTTAPGSFLPVIALPASAAGLYESAGQGAMQPAAQRELFTLVDGLLLPLLRKLERLEDDRCGYGLTLILPPLLLHALADAALADRLAAHLQTGIDRAQAHCQNAPNDRKESARLLLEERRDRLFWFDKQYARRLNPALQRLAAYGNLELAVSTATPCALPLLRSESPALRAQIMVACDAFCETFGLRPRGIGLPDCAFFPGLEEHLAAAGLAYFFVPPAALVNASAPTADGPHRPLLVKDGLAAFALHPEPAAQIASAKTGYYLDHHYRAPDAPAPESASAFPQRRDGKGYDPVRALRQADQHAAHYLGLLQKHLAPGRSAAVLLPGELLAREWTEFSPFLDYFFRKMHYDQKAIAATTPRHCLSALAAAGDPLQKAIPGEGTMREGEAFTGYYDAGADAVLPELHLAAGRLRAATGDPRILRQMGRELLLAQRWNGGAEVERKAALEAARRHLARFCALERMLAGAHDEATLAALEAATPVFPFLDVRHFQS